MSRLVFLYQLTKLYFIVTEMPFVMKLLAV